MYTETLGVCIPIIFQETRDNMYGVDPEDLVLDTQDRDNGVLDWSNIECPLSPED